LTFDLRFKEQRESEVLTLGFLLCPCSS